MQDSYFNSHSIEEETARVREVESKSVLFELHSSFKDGQSISLMFFVFWTKSCDSKLKLSSFQAYQTFTFKPPSYFWRNPLLCDPTRKAREASPHSLEPGTGPGSVIGLFQLRPVNTEQAIQWQLRIFIQWHWGSVPEASGSRSSSSGDIVAGC